MAGRSSHLNRQLSRSTADLVASQGAERPRSRNKVEIALGIGNKRVIAELEATVDAQDFLIKGLKDTIAVKQKAADKLSELNAELQTELQEEREITESFERLCCEQLQQINDLKEQLAEKHKIFPLYKKNKTPVSCATASGNSSLKNSRSMPEIIAANDTSSEDSSASDDDQLPLDETKQAVVGRKKFKFWQWRFSSKQAPKEKKPKPKKSKKKDFTEPHDSPTSQYGTQAEKNRAQLLKRQIKESTKRSLAIVLDTEQISSGILEDLDGQHEQLNRIERKHNGMSGDQEKESPPKQKMSPKLSRASKTPPGSPKPRRKLSEQPPLQQEDLPSTGSDVVDENLIQIGNVLNVLKEQAIATGAAIDRNNEQIFRNREREA